MVDNLREEPERRLVPVRGYAKEGDAEVVEFAGIAA
jgi:hypothetical protein